MMRLRSAPIFVCLEGAFSCIVIKQSQAGTFRDGRVDPHMLEKETEFQEGELFSSR